MALILPYELFLAFLAEIYRNELEQLWEHMDWKDERAWDWLDIALLIKMRSSVQIVVYGRQSTQFKMHCMPSTFTTSSQFVGTVPLKAHRTQHSRYSRS
jgi:hypothetical protein